MTPSSLKPSVDAMLEAVLHLESAKESIEVFLDNMPVCFIVIKKGGTIFKANQQGADLLSGTIEDVHGKNFINIFQAKSQTILIDILDKLNENPKLEFLESLQINPQFNPSQRSYLWTIGNIRRTNSANANLFSLIGSDITDKVLAEKRVEMLYKNIPLGFITIGADGICTSAYNQRSAQLLGTEDITGRPYQELLFHPLKKHGDTESTQIAEQQINRFLQGELSSSSLTINIIYPLGTLQSNAKRCLEVSVHKVLDSGIEKNFIFVIQDKSDLDTQHRLKVNFGAQPNQNTSTRNSEGE